MREFLIVFRAPYVPRRTDLRAEKMNTFLAQTENPKPQFQTPGLPHGDQAAAARSGFQPGN